MSSRKAHYKVRERGIVVAIDGPSGAGKSTVGRALAEALHYTYLDTGAMYRALALRAIEENIPLTDESALAALGRRTLIDFADSGRRVLVDGRDVTDPIRTREVTMAASSVAKLSEVRRELVSRQQQLGDQGGVVLDGRDIGSVVFPNAEVKFYLDADTERRARRRLEELQAKGQRSSYEAILDEIRARDHQDMTRLDSPLIRSTDSHYVDTTDLSPAAVVAILLESVRERIAMAASNP